MSDAILFSSFRSSVLKRIDAVFPDRSAQWRELKRISLLSEISGPPSPSEASLLVRYLDLLVEIQRRNTVPASSSDVLAMLRRLSEFSVSVAEQTVSEPVRDQIRSILAHFTSYCMCYLVFILHLYIYRLCPQCTCYGAPLLFSALATPV